MKKNNKLDVWVISRVSVFLNESIHSEQGGSVYWHFQDGTVIEVDCTNKEIKFVDWVKDDKSYYSIVGVAAMAGYEYNDYFSPTK